MALPSRHEIFGCEKAVHSPKDSDPLIGDPVWEAILENQKGKVAETERFELSVRFPVRRFSKALVSATHPRLRAWQEAGYSGSFSRDQRKLRRSLRGKRRHGYHGPEQRKRAG